MTIDGRWQEILHQLQEVEQEQRKLNEKKREILQAFEEETKRKQRVFSRIKAENQ